MALQLGSMYFLASLMAVAVLSSTTQPEVVRNYLIALWLADMTHVGLTAHALGPQGMLDVGQWNAMTWGNIAFTVRAQSFARQDKS